MSDDKKLEVAILIADANNFIMTLQLSGDQVIQAADILNRCGVMFKQLQEPVIAEAEKEDNV